MSKILVVWFLLIVNSISFSQVKLESREEKLQQLKSRDDIKVTEIQKDILKLKYPNGKVLYKNIADYKGQTSPPSLKLRRAGSIQDPVTSIQQPVYSPTYDSTIIDLTTIDTTLYYQKYSFWQEVPLSNLDFDHIRVGDVNKNGRPELYGSRKLFWSDLEPVTVYELNESGLFKDVFQYDSVLQSWNIYDVDRDGEEDVHLGMGGTWGVVPDQRFFSKPTDTSLATQLNFTFIPYDGSYQMNDITLGDFDKDGYTDLLFARGAGGRDVHIFEYNPFINSFDSVYRFAVYEDAPWGNSGFSVGDFDLDGKTDIVFGTGKGAVYVIENEGDNLYINSWLGSVESYHAYVHTWTHDIDKNGKPEFWVLADAYYSGVGTTRITIFETNGDNSYQTVGRVDLIGVFSFSAGTMQAVDIDNDGRDEVAVCIDGNFLILKFNGSENHQTYEVYYIKQNDILPEDEFQIYYGAAMYDLLGNDRKEFEILISMIHIIVQPGEDLGRFETKIYRPDSITSVDPPDNNIPNSIVLHQNYPNPFNPSTKIKFEIPEYSSVTVKVYNILGKEIKELLNESRSSGEQEISWNGKDNYNNAVPSGIYFITMKANPVTDKTGSFQKTIKAVLLK